MKNYYLILGLEPKCTVEEIKKAYKEYAKHYHPDRHSGNEFFSQKFIEIKEAYDNLNNIKLKEAHDLYHGFKIPIPPTKVKEIITKKRVLKIKQESKPYKNFLKTLYVSSFFLFPGIVFGIPGLLMYNFKLTEKEFGGTFVLFLVIGLIFIVVVTYLTRDKYYYDEE